MKVRDHLVMPVRYQGTNLSYGLGYKRERPRSTQDFSMLLCFGRIQTEPVPEAGLGARFKAPTASMYWGTMRYQFLHDVFGLASPWKLRAGPAAYAMINARYSERWDNSAINYDGALVPLALVTQIERRLQTKRKKFISSFQIEIPLLAYTMRPEFSGVPDFLDHERDFLHSVASTENSGWGSINRLPRVTTEVGITLLMRSSNRLRLAYGWDYYTLPDPLRVRAASHSFLLTLFTHL
ncbi:MAG: hypothetical protein KTR24_05480 [Saprospiraceae bacterium]|nr:hypothetical protein [Saprospiraceae bacterium]